MAFGLTRTRRIRPDDTPASLGMEFEHVSFPSADGAVQLAGWLVPPVQGQPLSGTWLVIVHGFGTHRGDPQAGALALSRELHALGMGVLAFDLRGCGESGGGAGSAGFHEQQDLLGALAYLRSRGAAWRSIGVHGFSLGGVVALTAIAGEGLAGAVVSDSAFADLWEMIRANSTGLKRATVPFHSGLGVLARWMYRIEIDAVSPVRAVAASGTPLLIIHGDQDQMVPVGHARRIHEAAVQSPGRKSAELWVAPESGHVQAFHTHRQQYVRRVADFFGRTLTKQTG
jgi:hypothetical protein